MQSRRVAIFCNSFFIFMCIVTHIFLSSEEEEDDADHNAEDAAAAAATAATAATNEDNDGTIMPPKVKPAEALQQQSLPRKSQGRQMRSLISLPPSCPKSGLSQSMLKTPSPSCTTQSASMATSMW
jgi:hypothetical protein